MTLGTLLDAVDIDVEVLGGREAFVSGLAVDSRRVRPGDLFFALAGAHTDAHRLVPEAIARGAAAIIAARADANWRGVPVVVTGDVRRCLGLMASRFHGNPSAHLAVVAVTGTNGKTSVTYMLEELWRAAGVEAGVIGTVNYRYGGVVRPAPLTTPEAPDLQSAFAAALSCGSAGVAVEVSSHALAADRVRGCQWDCAVFTNLSHDHLDFHGDLDSYYGTKTTLFLDHLASSTKPDPVAVINIDDPFGARLVGELPMRVITFGSRARATVHPLEMRHTMGGLDGALSVDGRMLRVASPLIGKHNLYNLMAAVGAAHGIGLPVPALERGVRACRAAPGRLERIGSGGRFAVFVDYAHTPHALESVLGALREVSEGRILTVFGCGGDRDRAKRPLMGAIAARLSDVVVLTSDNPRTEDPETIMAEIEGGMSHSELACRGCSDLPAADKGYTSDVDRRRAIALALRCARPGDVVLVAGKGHEDYQIVGTERHSLDDRVEVRRLLGEEA